MTTWNPSDAGAGITFSNGNLTVACPSGTVSVRATTSRTNGKYYYEALCGGTIGNCGIGIASATANVGTIGPGQMAYINVANGLVFVNGSNVGGGGVFAAGDVCCVATDLVNQKIWWRRNGGFWDNVSSDNPATNTGGFDLSTWITLGTAVFPVTAFNSATAIQVTADFGASNFAQAVPSGFFAWDPSVFTIHPFL